MPTPNKGMQPTRQKTRVAPCPALGPPDTVAGCGGGVYNTTMLKPQIVIDTSVLLAGLRSSRGQAFRLLQLVDTGRFEINLSVALVIEYESVLLRELPNLPVPRSVVDDVINFHCAVANRH
jgi:PIN domain